MKKINICFVTDENYAPHTAVTICSILKNAKFDEIFHFFIFNNDITEKTKEKIKQMENNHNVIEFIDVSHVMSEFQNLKQVIPHISKTSYLKFAIADSLPDIDKILYLDGDMIIKSSLYVLYNVNLEDHLIGAVEYVGYTYWSKHNDDLKLKFKCMNSGVMVINCCLWRKEKLSQKLLECAKDHNKVGFGQDQPVLNFVMRDRILFLPFKWNVQDTFFRDEVELKDRPERLEIERVKKQPGIIHYTFVRKPWADPSMNKADEYWKYYKISPFYDKKTYLWAKEKYCKKKNTYINIFWKKFKRIFFSIKKGEEYNKVRILFFKFKRRKHK